MEAVISGDVATLPSMLRDNLDLVRARSTRRHHATLLFYVAANGVEQRRIPGDTLSGFRGHHM